METVTKRLYEGLFLVDSGEAAADWQGINDHVKKVLERNEVEIVKMCKWDERPLAYPILGRKRGTYILVYFNAPCGKLGAIERDAQLSERILRILILRGDHITPENMEKDTPATIVEKKQVASASAVKAAEEAKAAAAAEAKTKAEAKDEKVSNIDEKDEATAENKDDGTSDVDEKQD
ncbi:MAG: 30S ribosomal protein S6 [Planctomycetes bacterium]|nr:30S ribosomal protein S6 [Planctomycetota bacterium]MBU1518029.1 30S ribosomal protein S6 [Planctomycetota bacterium]MBU2458213.1 30S ribosomal protein S6 [Planctomycetota bacterium]